MSSYGQEVAKDPPCGSIVPCNQGTPRLLREGVWFTLFFLSEEQPMAHSWEETRFLPILCLPKRREGNPQQKEVNINRKRQMSRSVRGLWRAVDEKEDAG